MVKALNIRNEYGNKSNIGLGEEYPLVVEGSTERVKIVDIIIEDSKEDEFPRYLIWLKLVNVGNEGAFLNKIEFHVEEVFELIRPAFPYAVQSSWLYDVDLPLGRSICKAP